MTSGVCRSVWEVLIEEWNDVRRMVCAYEIEVTLQPLCAAALHIRLPVCYIS